MNAWQLLPALRDLFARRPEMIALAAYHLQWALFALRYTDELEDEVEIAATADIARTDWTGRAA